MKEKLISAQEIVKKYNLTYQTVTYYTNINLLHVVTRKGNVRLYSETDVKKRLTQSLLLINNGYPLRLVCKKLNGV